MSENTSKNMQNLRGKVISGLVWKLLERLGAQIVTFFVSVVLARILTPEESGTVALVIVFINIANVFVSDGFGSALIQKKQADQIDFSSVFYFNLAFSFLLYFIIFLCSGLIADFYNMPELKEVICVLALKLPLAAINSVQQAYVARKMIFRKFFFSTLIGTAASAFVGIGMALQGYGVWALVGQYLTNSLISTLTLAISVQWHPSLVFSFQRLKGLITYGWKLLVAALATTFFSELRNLIIGKRYTASDLAYYNKGQQIPSMLITNVNTSIDSVLFSAISKCQDDVEAVKRMTRRALKTSTFIIFPIMTGLALVSRPLMLLLLTEKWSDCIVYMQIACVTFAFMPIHTANLQAMKALGRSDIYLKLDIVKKVYSIIVLGIAMWFGPLSIALSGIVTTIISCIVNITPNKKLINYSIREQLSDIGPSIILSTFMGICVYFSGRLIENLWLQMVLQIFVGMTVYILMSAIFRNETFYYILSIIHPIVNKYVSKRKA